MSYIAGHPPKVERSYWPPALQFALAVGLLGLGRWADLHAPHARTTDQWAFNSLALCCYLLGLLFLPFALAALVKVIRNRRKDFEIVRR
ncbi:MAG: hypothetical protein LCH77_08300 [Actinobacteria bacterium]|nr:hypothetical protein [Actinomycetota bacterium]